MFNRQFKTVRTISRNKIRICTYNILAQAILEISDKHKLSCSKNCIAWKNRLNLILKDIIKYNIDIICLQEVQSNLFYDDMIFKFMDLGYYGIFTPQKLFKKKNKLFTNDKNFGVCIFFKKNKFNLLSFESFNYYRYADQYLRKNKSYHLYRKKIHKRFSGLVTIFNEKKTNKNFCLSTTHLESSPMYDDIKNLQAFILLKYIYFITNKGDMPIIICGDFNSKPDSSLYIGITTGLSKNKFNSEDLESQPLFIETPETFTKLKLKSVYNEVFGNEPKLTNYTIDFKDTIDYIFINHRVRILSCLKEVNKNYFTNITSLPNKEIPSDHIIQICDVEII